MTQSDAAPIRTLTSSSVAATPAVLKRWRTAQARALLAGYRATLIEGDDGRPLLVVDRWAMTRGFTDLGALEAWLDRAAGSRSPGGER